MNKNFWKNKKVLITGHTGFKGSWLSLWLKNLGASVFGYSDSIPTKPSHYELLSIDNKIKSYYDDIQNLTQLSNFFEESKPEIIFHMAAQSLVQKSYQKPIQTYSTNVMGTVNLLECVRNVNPRVVIIVTSDKCYENKENKLKLTEEDPMGGYDPYSSSKGCAELIVSSYRNSFFNTENISEHNVSLSSVRAGNVIGGGDWSENRLIPDIVKHLMNDSDFALRNPESIRPWQFVLDPLYGYLLLAEKMWQNGKEFSSAWNFGPGDENLKPVSWILNKFSEKWNKKLIINSNVKTNHEMNYLALDSTKAKTKLGWETRLDMDTTIDWIIDWYKNYENKSNIYDFSLKQITNYQELIQYDACM